jgi:hypothetical protein
VVANDTGIAPAWRGQHSIGGTVGARNVIDAAEPRRFRTSA